MAFSSEKFFPVPLILQIMCEGQSSILINSLLEGPSYNDLTLLKENLTSWLLINNKTGYYIPSKSEYLKMGSSICHYFPLTTIDSRSWAKLFMTYAEVQRSKNFI
ncbi:uncharacterized protein LOC123475514 [Daphnia magna]|nr:uncharacterized protein LOC123475514 [Daphnia magna]